MLRKSVCLLLCSSMFDAIFSRRSFTMLSAFLPDAILAPLQPAKVRRPPNEAFAWSVHPVSMINWPVSENRRDITPPLV